jgi:outer membrane protein TolC
MHRTTLLALALVVACSTASGPQDAVLPASELQPVVAPAPVTPPAVLTDLSVPQAVAVALSRNPDLGVAAERILAARQDTEAVRSAWYPHLNLSLDYVYTTDPVLVFMQKLRQRELDMTADMNHPGNSENSRLSADLAYRIFDGGRRQAMEDLADSGVALEEEARDAILNGLKAEVIGMSLVVYEATEFIRVAEESVQLVTQQLAISRSQFEAGSAQRSDVLSVEVRLAEAREEVVRAKNSRERAMTALRNLLGLTAAEEFSLGPRGTFTVPPVLDEDLLAVARENRPELRRAEEAVRAAEHSVALARAGRVPTVDAFGSYALDADDFGFTIDQDSAVLGVRLDWAAFQGFRTGAEIAAAQARVRAAREAQRRAVLDIETDVSSARLELDEARERMAVAGKSAELAEEALALIRARYESGAATITEYLNAEVALTGARVRNVAARYDEQRATADLRRALGVCRAGQDGLVGDTGAEK